MLTADLLKVRFYNGRIIPRYLNPSDQSYVDIAIMLIDLFNMQCGQAYSDLKESLVELESFSEDIFAVRGLSKILMDQGKFEVDTKLEPKKIRRRLFELATPNHPVSLSSKYNNLNRDKIIEITAEEFNITKKEVELYFYADLPDAYILKEIPDIDPIKLIHRYNLALAQAIVMRARSINIYIKTQQNTRNSSAQFRQLFRYIKFFKLMYTINKSSTENELSITLDGPLSLLKHSQKYGLQFANFLPALILCTNWSLTADIIWGKHKYDSIFKIDSKMGFYSHYPDNGVYETREEKWLKDRFPLLNTKWEMIFEPQFKANFSQDIIIPDIIFKHPDGRVAYLEIIGFWRKSYLEQRISVYKKNFPDNWILAVSKQLQGCVEALKEFSSRISFFREAIVPKDILNMVELFAKKEKSG